MPQAHLTKVRLGMWSCIQKFLTFDPLARREIELDFVRGIAILLAMGWHFNHLPTNFGPANVALAPGRYIGWAGVDLFFVLSGFLVGGLLFREYEKTNGFRYGQFLLRRVFKIWPVLYIFILLQFLGRVHPWNSFLPQTLFHVQNYFPTPISHLWSLAVEEHFYLVFAVSFWFLANKRADISSIPKVLLAVFVLCFAMRVAATLGGVDPIHIQWQTHYRIDALACGVMLAYLSIFETETFKRLYSSKVPLLAFWIAGSLLLAQFDAHSTFICTIGYTISYAAAASFLLFCYRLPILTSGAFPARIVAWIGTYSYAMYVYHPSMLRISDAVLARVHLGQGNAYVLLGVRYFGAIIAAVVMTKLIERPFLALRDFLFPPIPGSHPEKKQTEIEMSAPPPLSRYSEAE